MTAGQDSSLLPARAAPLQGCHCVGTSVQLSKPIVHGRNKACISDEESRKLSGQGSDPAHICSKKTMCYGDLFSMIYSP